MPIEQLDHINIRSVKLDESLLFYRDIIGLSATPPPSCKDFSKGIYFCDSQGTAIIHLIAVSEQAESIARVRGTAQHGMIDHFALRSSGSPNTLKKALDKHGLVYEAFDVDILHAHLVFVIDPNGVNVEIAFPL
jgi:catechol 2,3-dioxygenase-like lactoylglutathione lyase family enzyme